MSRHNTISTSGGFACSSAGVAVARRFYGSSEYFSAAQKIEKALRETELEPGETRPSNTVISGITAIVDEVSKRNPMPAEAEVSVFFGEALVTWRCASREISLVSRGNADDPKILQYEAGKQEPSRHRMVANATPKNLKDALVWLYA